MRQYIIQHPGDKPRKIRNREFRGKAIQVNLRHAAQFKPRRLVQDILSCEMKRDKGKFSFLFHMERGGRFTADGIQYTWDRNEWGQDEWRMESDNRRSKP